MPRIRTIKPEFIDEERCAKVSMQALLLFVFMKPFCDDWGIITANCQLIKSKVFPIRKDIREENIKNWIKELSDNSFLVPFNHTDGKSYYALDFTQEKIDKPGTPILGKNSPYFLSLLQNSRIVANDFAGVEGKGAGKDLELEFGKDAGAEDSPRQPEKNFGNMPENPDFQPLYPSAASQQPTPPFGAPPPPNMVMSTPETGREKGLVAWEEIRPRWRDASTTKQRLYDMWLDLCSSKEWHPKSQKAVNNSLKKLSEYEEGFARELLDAAISGEYQNVVFADTIVKYQKWQKTKSKTPNDGNDSTSFGNTIVPERVEYGKL